MFRIQRKIRIVSGVRVNISKSRPTITIGPPGLKITVYAGRAYRLTLGIQGTGLFWSWWYYNGGIHRSPPPIETSDLSKLISRVERIYNHDMD